MQHDPPHHPAEEPTIQDDLRLIHSHLALLKDRLTALQGDIKFLLRRGEDE